MSKSERYSVEQAGLRSPEQSDEIHEMTLSLLKRKGITAEQATYDDYASCAEIAEQVVASEATTAAGALAVAATIGSPSSDEKTGRLLAHFACDGKYIRDCSITEAEFLAAAIAAEEAKEPSGENGARTTRTITAEMTADAEYCDRCGYHVKDYGCQCQ